MAAKEIGVELIQENFWERRKEFVAINTAGTVPVLFDNSTSAIICNSSTIIEYIEEKHQDGENFLGDANNRCVTLLKQAVEQHNETLIFIAGPSGAGKTHLMYAAMSFFELHHDGLACYFSMDDFIENDDIDESFFRISSILLTSLFVISSFVSIGSMT